MTVMVNPHATVAPQVPGWRRSPIGVEVAPDGSIHARVWAPRRTTVSFVEMSIDDATISTTELDAEGTGYFSGMVPGARAGTLYKFRLDERGDFPDPASRFQPTGPHGPSQIVDAVYNHLGPDGNYLKQFSEHYFKGSTEWGEALNFDGDGSAPVREFFTSNAAYWVEEFHFDGLRLDATQQIFDTSPTHIIAEVAARVREAARPNSTIIVAENEPEDSKLVRSRNAGGDALDAMWNDDFHHR